MSRVHTDVLITGAGPSGLVLAISLASQGVKVRITDKAPATASTSRALLIHARTLELYRQLGLGDGIAARSHKLGTTNIWTAEGHRASIPFGSMGKDLSPYPYLCIFPQDFHERMLEERLNALGVQVERNCELVGFAQDDQVVTAQIRDNNSPSKDLLAYEAHFIVGCDGAHSAVRNACGIEYEGGTYSRPFFVADIEGSGPTLNGDAHVCLNGTDLLLIFGYDNTGHRGRLTGTVDEKRLANKDWADVTLDDVASETTGIARLHIDKVNWFSVYRVHHRVSNKFRNGRAFLVGDAAHIHSPVGGQGMNTGIGDAMNLAWKLAAVLKSKTTPAGDLTILDSYEVERRAFALVLVSTTDNVFTNIVAEGYVANFLRQWLIPYVAPVLARFDFVKQNVFRKISQIMLNYRDSALSAGCAGSVHGGDRVPWAPVGDVDNFDSLKAITWQVHVYGAAKEEMSTWCQSVGIPLHVYSWNGRYSNVGLERDAAYLVRPDSYVAVAEQSGLPHQFEEFVKENNLRLD